MQVVVIALVPHYYSISLLLNVIITNKTNKGDSRYLARLAQQSQLSGDDLLQHIRKKGPFFDELLSFTSLQSMAT